VVASVHGLESGHTAKRPATLPRVLAVQPVSEGLRMLTRQRVNKRADGWNRCLMGALGVIAGGKGSSLWTITPWGTYGLETCL
jgi:hypothetical protein